MRIQLGCARDLSRRQRKGAFLTVSWLLLLHLALGDGGEVITGVLVEDPHARNRQGWPHR
jgi:hypothetical protein